MVHHGFITVTGSSLCFCLPTIKKTLFCHMQSVVGKLSKPKPGPPTSESACGALQGRGAESGGTGCQQTLNEQKKWSVVRSQAFWTSRPSVCREAGKPKKLFYVPFCNYRVKKPDIQQTCWVGAHRRVQGQGHAGMFAQETSPILFRAWKTGRLNDS